MKNSPFYKIKRKPYDIDIFNLILIKLLLLKVANFNIYKYLNIISKYLNIKKKLPFETEKIIEKGIDIKNIIKYLSNRCDVHEIRLIIDMYNTEGKIDLKKITIFLEKNKNIIENYMNFINLQLIILIGIIYLLPIVLIISSFFFKIDPLFLILIPLILIIFLIKKIKKLTDKIL